MYATDSPEGYYAAAPGIRIKTLCYGASSLMTRFSMEAGAALPDHAHAHEQIGFLVSGRIRLHIGGRSLELGPGDSWCVPSKVRHRADILEASEAIEVFTPCREEYKEFFGGEA